MSKLYRTKKELRTALTKDVKDRTAMKKRGYSTKGITQVIQRKKRILSSKRYWR